MLDQLISKRRSKLRGAKQTEELKIGEIRDLPKLRLSSRGFESKEEEGVIQSKTIDIPRRNPSSQVSERRLRSSKSVCKFEKLPSMSSSCFYPNQQALTKKLKLLKTKLEYEWTHIYRTLLSRDLDQQECVSSNDFKAALLRAGIYLDKQSWRTVQTNFASGDTVFYKEMSHTLGLHRQALQNMNPSRISSFLSRLRLKRSPRETKLHPMHKSMSENQLKNVEFNTLGRNPSVLKRLFRNFDEQNNSHVSQHDFLNITNKMGMQLSSRDIEPFKAEEVIKEARQLKLNENSRKINYKKFLERLEQSRQGI